MNPMDVDWRKRPPLGRRLSEVVFRLAGLKRPPLGRRLSEVVFKVVDLEKSVLIEQKSGVVSKAGELKKSLPSDPAKVLKWMLLSKKFNVKDISRKFKLKKREAKKILNELEKHGDLRAEETRRLLVFKSVKCVILESETVKELKKALSPSEWNEGYVRVFKTRIDIIVDIAEEFGSMDASTLAGFFGVSLESIKKVAYLLQRKNLVDLQHHASGEITLVRK